MSERLDDAEVATALADLDRRISALGLDIWIGAEPTFTDRFSSAPEWLSQALGADKEARARRLVARLAAEAPGAALLRTPGRRYPGEAEPRFSYGLLARRDGTPVWAGPPDPLRGGAPADPQALERLDACLSAELGSAGGGAAPATALVTDGGAVYLALDVPASDADGYERLLRLAAHAANTAGIAGLILRGAAPPPDPALAWSTLTPDPGVIEVNQAPWPSVYDLWGANRPLYRAAAEEGLTPLRLHYNGLVDDSGGGGQLSIGGPTPEASPFRVQPQLLPRLVRYLNRHPSLSYWFAPHYLGACSQAPRPDEGVADLFDELGLALEQLAERPGADPAFVWRSLSPFLRDVSGDSHRSELNIEKLWSLWPRPDAIDGVVEFRAFRMGPTPEHLAALAALIRALVAMLMVRPYEAPLVRWGERLHDRFALPYFLLQDLDEVLAELADSGLGLDPILTDRLRADPGREIGQVNLGSTVLTLSSALEFWPQVGDTLSQPADSRLVDASTARLQVLLCGGSAESLAGWRLTINGFLVPLHVEGGPGEPAALIGVRYRRFPAGPLGLHPGIEPVLPIRLRLDHVDGRRCELDYHEWRPDGGPYPDLPGDLDEAARRRAERLVTRLGEVGAPDPAGEPRAAALSDYGFDLRRT
ncbi:MAG: transglutaminase family protein [Chromatiaceae bacterium]|jgi:uncharacterized protein (DUF2126 family)|nr:transglutaminase family protein [Chromatiaceae bacterium]